MKRSVFSLCFVLLIFTLAFANTTQKRGAKTPTASSPSTSQAALNSITSDGLMRHINRLGSDEFEGRAPGTAGEEKTVNYLESTLKNAGLAPGNTDGTYIQKVPLVGITTSQDSELKIKTAGKELNWKFGEDFVARTVRVVEKTSFDADMVFVGYGVVAPEYGWDDYKGLDVRGKVLVMLVNDPPIPDPKDASKLNPKMFGGRAMTYYGRWTYKYEIAAQKGAAGIFIVHETAPAAYPWAVPRGSFSVENFDLVSKDNNMSRVNVEGWITNERARELFGTVGMSFDAMKKAAIRRDFKPVDLKARARLTVESKIRRIDSKNIVAKLEGSDPRMKNEYVIYTAHWDHFGVSLPDAKGDKIYNGALDNASGCAVVLEIARAFKALPKAPARSLLFLFVTAEEKGLIGSKFYAENPIYPLEKTVANINIDGVNQWGRTKDITVIGLGNSTLDEVLREAASAQGRVLRPDAEPEKGLYYRSDHFNFAKQGVPALDPDSGVDYIGKPADYGRKKREDYTANDYHKPSDEVKADWDLAGAIEDAQLMFAVGFKVANTAKYPQWSPGTEFKATRDAMLRKANKK